MARAERPDEAFKRFEALKKALSVPKKEIDAREKERSKRTCKPRAT